MSDVVRNIKDALAECPICTDYFHDPSRIPRRMPCCSQAICEPCLETYTRGRQKLSCPLCRQQHQLSDGVKSLPKEVVVLRFLDILKTQSNAVPACTDCPDNNQAMAKCDSCGVYLCQPCRTAHSRHISTRHHQTTTFAAIQRCRSSRPGGRTRDTSKLKEKLEGVGERVKVLSGLVTKIAKSKMLATDQITSCFAGLIEKLQHRKAILLSQVDLKADQKRKSVNRAIESHKAFQLKLEKSTDPKSSTPVEPLLNKSPEDVEYDRLGISFIPAYIQHLTDTIKSAGQVRTVDFRPKERPDDLSETQHYNAIQIQPDDFPQVPDVDKKIPGGNSEIIYPHLEWDRNTASSDVTVSGTEISNTRPDLPPPESGCRIKLYGRVLATRPVVIRSGQRVMYHVKVRYYIKQMREEKRAIFETALTSSPIETFKSQRTGLSVTVLTCSDHKQQLCLRVKHDGKTLTHIPLTRIQTGVSRDLYLCFVLEGDENKIHVVDVNDIKVIKSVTGVRFDRPLWVMMCVDNPKWSDMTGELVSGNKVTVTQEMTQLLSSLY